MTPANVTGRALRGHFDTTGKVPRHMRPLRILLALSLTAALLANATTAGAIAYRRIDAVSFWDEGHGWISGGRGGVTSTGFVSYTDDGGSTWRTTTRPRWLYGTAADGPSSGWAVSDVDNFAYRSTDGGATWTEKRPAVSGGSEGLRGVVQLGSRTVLFGSNFASSMGRPAVIVSSVDGGATWSKQYEGPAYPAPNEFTEPPSTSAQFISGDTTGSGVAAWIAGNEWNVGSGGDSSTQTFKQPLIFKTSNGGSTWTTQTITAAETGGWPVTSIAVGSDTVAFLATAGNNRLLARTTNGTSWQTLTLPRIGIYTNPTARAVDAYGENTLLVGGSGGFLAWSDNAKLTPAVSVASDWTYNTLPGSPNINAVQLLSPTVGIAVGDEETIAKTTDAGATWTLLPAGPPSSIITAPGAGYGLTSAPITIQGTAADQGVGVAKVEVRISRADGSTFNGVGWTPTETWLTTATDDRWATWSRVWTPDTALLASGQMVTITARATDGAGLTSLTPGRTSALPMSASIALGGGAQYTASSTVAAAVVANGATHMRWKVGNDAFGAWQPYSTSASVNVGTADGEKVVSFEFSTDGSTVAAVATDAITLHTLLPSIAMATPAANFSTSGPVSITGTASDDGAPIVSVQIRIRRTNGQSWNGGQWVTADSWIAATSSNGYSTWSYDWSPSSLNGEGVTIHARAVDAANLIATTLGISSANPPPGPPPVATQPTIAVVTPSAFFPLTLLPVDITGTAEDASGVSEVEVLIRRSDGFSWTGVSWTPGDNWQSTSSANEYANWSYSWMPGLAAIEPGGLVTLYARATSKAGIIGESAGIPSGSPVRASMVLNGGRAYTATTTVQAELVAPSMTSMRYEVSGEQPSVWAQFTAQTSVRINGGEGSKTVRFQFSTNGRDVAAETTRVPLLVDLSPPSIDMTAPVTSFRLGDSPTVAVRGTASDAGSGVSDVDVRVRRGDQYWTGVSWQGTEVWLPATISGGTWAYNWVPDVSALLGDAPVTISARAVDRAGGIGMDPNPITSANPSDPAVALTTASKTLSYGGIGTVSGTLKVLGEPLSNTQVILRSGTSSTTLKDTTARATTNSLGQFSFAVKPSIKTYYQVRAPQTATHAGSSSGTIAFTPKVYLTRPYAPLTARRSTAFTSYGYLKPKHAADTYPARIYLYRYVNGSWRYYRYVNAKASTVSSYTQYSASVRLPYAGKWRIRAYHADGGHAATWSTYRYVTVR